MRNAIDIINDINEYTVSRKIRPLWRLYETVESKWGIIDDNNSEWYAIPFRTKQREKAINFLKSNNIDFN